MFTNDIYQIGTIYYEERVNEAALRRAMRRQQAAQRARATMFARLGDWFINIGMKLKAQQSAPRMDTSLAQR
jgi:hypothetical protein